MKKIVILIMIFLLTGCGLLSNTPKKRVEEFLSNYQTLDKEVIDQLDYVVSKEDGFNSSQRDTYKDIMKKHYKNIKYEIKDEEINGDTGKVKVEIEVTDYTKVLSQAETYFQGHHEEFKDEQGEYKTKFIDYKLDQMKNCKDKVKYTIEFIVNLSDDKWEVEQLNTEDFDKLSGTYKY